MFVDGTLIHSEQMDVPLKIDRGDAKRRREGGIRRADRICQAMKKYRWPGPAKDECIGTMSTSHVVSLSLSLSLSLFLSLFSCTLTPNFPHFNPNLTDSPTVRLEYTGQRERTRISPFPSDPPVRGKAPGTKSAECASASWRSPVAAFPANCPCDILKETRVIL